ncbi:unnamed protein product [Rotaria magnacalcarata]|uniref:Uncharacterized protein n=1 Tax=Rotaria magnacalcarata TaxID=392030 RepID=A0A816XTZ7_9BILA|nr:unnamed protein product [Rotaria magnacalcarata]CAF4171898.1 unnamed protein product [Rotaria magnacalcarata]
MMIKEEQNSSISFSISISIVWTPLRASRIDISENAHWQQKGITVAGGNRRGREMNQLYHPNGLFVDDEETVYVADRLNNRIVQWKANATTGEIVAGETVLWNRVSQVGFPTDVIVDKETDSLIICDRSNRRMVLWPRRNGACATTIISNIACRGWTMDENRSLYVSDNEKHEVRRYRIGESQGTVVAGGNGEGNRLDQLKEPRYVFVDRDHTVYVSDCYNHRVMKWTEGARKGIVVAGREGQGRGLQQLSFPRGVVVDQLGTVYVSDGGNNRIMRWLKGATEGTAIIDGQEGSLGGPVGLSFDCHGNIYAAEFYCHRVQRFDLINKNEIHLH